MFINPAVWEDGTPRSQANVFSWQTIDWSGPIKKPKKRYRYGKRQRSHKDRVIAALRNLE